MYFNGSIQREFSDDTNASMPNGLAKLITDIEKSNDKEIYNLTYKEIINGMLECSNVEKLDSIRVNLNFIIRYIKWMQQKKKVMISPDVIASNYLCGDITALIRECLAAAGIDDKKKIIYKSPEEFADVLGKAFRLDLSADSGEVNFFEITAVYLMLLYQGLTKKEVLELKLYMIRESENSIIISNKETDITVYEPFVNTIRKVLKNRIFLTGYGRQNMSVYVMGNSENDFFIETHNIREELGPLLNRSVYKGTVKFKELTGEDADFAANNVFKMGAVYRFMQAGDVDMSDDELVRYFTKQGFTKAAAYDVLQYCKQW